MSLLDLQGLDVTQSPGKKPTIKGSRASKGCFYQSSLSLILCGPSTFRPDYNRENGS